MHTLSGITVLAATLWLLTAAKANDSAASGIGGNWRLMSREHKTVQMVREHVVLRQLPEGGFETTADFEFRNHGKALTVAMGFPESASGDSAGNYATLVNFRSWVDRRRVAIRRVLVTDKEEDSLALYVKHIHFASGQTRHVRVHYTSASGGGYSSGDAYLEYDFTGGNWWGKVQESVLDVTLLPGRHYVESLATLRKDYSQATITHRGGFYRFRWRNWQAQEEFDFPLNSELVGALYAESPGTARPLHAASVLVVPGRPLIAHGAIQSPSRFDGFECNGHLWVRLSLLNDVLSPVSDDITDKAITWRLKTQRLDVHSTIGEGTISVRGTTANSLLWPPRSTRPLWMMFGDERELFVPACQVERVLPMHFTFDQRRQLVSYTIKKHEN